MWIEIVSWKRAIRKISVTPHAGVWIEILKLLWSSEAFRVTPHAGVWIEMQARQSE